MANVSGRLLFDRNRTATATAAMAGIPNVPIVLQNTATGVMLAVLTDSTGVFTFTNVPGGSYQLVEAYGTPATIVGTGSFASAAVAPMLDGGTVPPYSYVTNPVPGATNLDCTIRNTRLITITDANLTDQNFLNGPVLYSPIDNLLDIGVEVSGENLVTDLDNGTFGEFPSGTIANTGANPNPYPDIGSQFTFVQPNPNILAPADGQYTIQNIMNNAHAIDAGSWWVTADHDTGNETGRMMVVNGNFPGAVILTKTIPVESRKHYVFSSWIANLIKKTPGYANPAFGVAVYDQSGNVLYNQRLGDEIPINTSYPDWHEIGIVIQNPVGNTSLRIEFISQGPAATGNDYAIDSIGLFDINFPIYTPQKSASANTVNLGDTVTYTVTLDYPGNLSLTDAVFTDILPQGMDFVPGSVRVNGLSCPDANPEAGFSVPNISGGQTLTVIFDAVAAKIPDPNPIVNTATVSYSYTPVQGGITTRYDTETNEAEVAVLAADLTVEKLASNTTVNPGDFVTFTLMVTNNGPSAAANPVLVDNIPPQMRDVVYSTDGGTVWQTWNGSLFMPGLAPSETTQVLLRGQVQLFASGTFTNTTNIFSDTADPNPDNNSSSVAIEIIASADVSVVKSASPSSVGAVGVLTYTMVVSNAGPSASENVMLEDAAPEDLQNPEFSTDGGATWQTWTNPLSLGTLERSSATIVLLRGTIVSGATGSITNTATVYGDTADPNPDNNTSTITTPIDVPVPAEADLSVTKTAYPTITPGEEIEYTITVYNQGPDSAENVVLVDAIPVEILSLEYVIDDGAWQSWNGSLSLGTLLPNQVVTVLIRGTVGPAATEPITNTATAIGSTPDPDLSNNTSSIETLVEPSADVQITKVSLQNPATAGSLLTYRITVRNNGPSFAHNVVVQDDVPAGLLNPEYTTDGINWFPWEGSFTIDALAANASLNFRIRGTVDPDLLGTIVNEAEVSSDTPDPNLSNNTSETETDVGDSADVLIAKSVTPNPAKAGEEVTFTLHIANLGQSTAEDVTVSDTLPVQITGEEYSIDGGETWQAWTGSVAIGAIRPGVEFDVIIRGILSSTAEGSITNVAIVHSTTPDPNTANNTSTITFPVTPQIADLSINKSASPLSVQAGDVLTYTIAVQNLGPDAAINAVITDVIPAALSAPEYSINGGGEWLLWTGTLTIPEIEAQGKLTILIRGTVVDASAPITNTATVLSDTRDPDLSDNSGAATAFVPEPKTSADLSLEKSTAQTSAEPGDIITYEITVTNNGPDTATNVSINDTLPSEFISSTAEFSTDGSATWQPWTGTYTLDELAPNATETILLRGTLGEFDSAAIVNTAFVTSTTLDPDISNNFGISTIESRECPPCPPPCPCPPCPPISKEEALNQVVLSIAMEEFSLSHLICAESSKIQYVLDSVPGATVEDVLRVNEEAANMLAAITNLQGILKEKLSEALAAYKEITFTS